MSEYAEGLPIAEETDPAVQAFWDLARSHAHLNAAPGYFGMSTSEAVPPPTWSFGPNPTEADEGLADLLEVGSMVLTSQVADHQGMLPERGSLGIVLDGAGRPRALVGTSAVEVEGDEVHEHLDVVFTQD